MTDPAEKPYLAAIGISPKGTKDFTVRADTPQEPPTVEPHLIHNGTGIPNCSVCGSPVNIPAGTCAPCPTCGQNFGNTCG